MERVVTEEELWQRYHELFQCTAPAEHQKNPDSGLWRQAIATVAHDIKNPLTGVKLYADMLLSQVADPDVKIRSKYLAVISSEAERMSSMITNSIDYHNIMSGGAEWRDENVDVVSIIADCIKPVRRWCAAKGVEFVYTVDRDHISVSVDVDRFSRSLSVLLINALRFTDSGSIRLDIQSSDEILRLSVSDSGPGISDDRLLQIFQRDQNETMPGKNIGLAFASIVAGHYKGSVRVKNIPGNGSVFSIELPLAHDH